MVIESQIGWFKQKKIIKPQWMSMPWGVLWHNFMCCLYLKFRETWKRNQFGIRALSETCLYACVRFGNNESLSFFFLWFKIACTCKWQINLRITCLPNDGVWSIHHGSTVIRLTLIWQIRAIFNLQIEHEIIKLLLHIYSKHKYRIIRTIINAQ